MHEYIMIICGGMIFIGLTAWGAWLLSGKSGE